MKEPKILLSLLFILISLPFLSKAQSGNALTSKSFKISFYSKTPVEDINAESKVVSSVLIKNSKTIVFQVNVRSFKFPLSLMEDHFNESYMESEKYPIAKFKGTLLDSVDFSKDGVYPVRAQGVLTMHGVDKPREIKGFITIKNGLVKLNSEFNVPCADHKIEIPKIVFAKVSEVIRVTVEGFYDNH